MYFMYAVVARLIVRDLTLSQRKLWPLMVHKHNLLLLLGLCHQSQHMCRGNIALPPLQSSPELQCHRYIPTRTVSRNSSPITDIHRQVWLIRYLQRPSVLSRPILSRAIPLRMLLRSHTLPPAWPSCRMPWLPYQMTKRLSLCAYYR
jgi:hypothetical protein